jgi:hypothetical protein
MRHLFAARSRIAPAAKRFMNRYLETMAVADPTGLGWPAAYWPDRYNPMDQGSPRPVKGTETARPRAHHAA